MSPLLHSNLKKKKKIIFIQMNIGRPLVST